MGNPLDGIVICAVDNNTTRQRIREATDGIFIDVRSAGKFCEVFCLDGSPEKEARWDASFSGVMASDGCGSFASSGLWVASVVADMIDDIQEGKSVPAHIMRTGYGVIQWKP